MAERVIKTTIALDGEKAFKSAIQSVNSELKLFDSELKLVTAEFGKTDQGMKGLKATADVLSRKVTDQKAKIEALKTAVADSGDAYNKAKEKYAALDAELQKTKAAFGENSEEAKRAANELAHAAEAVNKAERNYNSYQTQLNSTQAELVQTTRRLEETSAAAKDLKNLKLSDLMPKEVAEKVEKVAKAFKDVATQAGKATAAAAKIGANTVKKSFEASAKALTAYATAAASAGAAIAKLTGDSAKWADDLNTLSKQTGVSTAELQKMQYAADLIDVDVDTITGSMAKLTKNMTSTSAAVTGAFQTLGVSVRDNVTGELRDNQEVFSELITALGQVENETERDNLAMQIFGKSAQELNPLILGGADALKELGKQAEESGLILSQDALDGLNAYNDSLDTLKANAAAAGNIISTAFAPKLQAITDRIGGAIPDIATSFGKMFSGDITAAGDFREKIKSLSKDITAEIKNMLPGLLNGFNTVILSIAENVPTMVIELLPSFVTGLKDLALGIVDLMPTMLPMIVQAGADLFSGLIGGLNEVIKKLTPMLPGLVRDIGNVLIENAPVIISTGFELLINLVNGITKAIPELIKKATELIPVMVDELLSPDNLGRMIQAGIDLITTLAVSLPEAIPVILEQIPKIISSIITALSEVDWFDTAGKVLGGLGEGLVNVFSGALGVIDGLFGTSLKKWYDDTTKFWREAGSKLYQTLHADEIKEAAEKGDASELKLQILRTYYDSIKQQLYEGVNQNEIDISTLFEEAINKNLSSAKESALFDTYIKEQLTDAKLLADAQEIFSTFNRDDFRELHPELKAGTWVASSIPTSVPEAVRQQASSTTINNYYTKAATPDQIRKDNEVQKAQAQLYA